MSGKQLKGRHKGDMLDQKSLLVLYRKKHRKT